MNSTDGERAASGARCDDFDPHRATYLDEKSVRDEMTREFDVCNGCRRCTAFCTSFPTLFDMLDARPGSDAGRLTPAQQDRVVDECFQCGRCATECPYTPDLHELAIDVPRLVQRAAAMRYAAGQISTRRRVTNALMGRTDAIGRLASALPSIANGVVGGRAGSLRRRIVMAVTGLSAARPLPTFVRPRFSAWMDRRADATIGAANDVTLFPTCIVEYQSPGLGADLVRVYERNGIGCRPSDAGCCGAPSLHAGAARRFARIAGRNVSRLAAEARRGDIVVVEPSCARAIAEYARTVSPSARADAELVARRLVTTAEPLMHTYRADAGAIDTCFGGPVPATIFHTGDDASYRLLALTGAHVEPVDQASGIGGLWSLRADHDRVADELTGRLAAALAEVGGGRPGTSVTGDSALANLAIADVTGLAVAHPIELLARAYGFAKYQG
ncbi:MAG: heterodisulfide reductase-related iron-sulfur binding cluster [Ilumatobacteraceae bacterium]